MDVKAEVLEQIMDMMDDRILGKLKKPEMPMEEDPKSIEIQKVKVGEEELDPSAVAEEKLESDDMEISPEILEQLMRMQEEE